MQTNTPPKVDQEPKKPEGVVLTDKQKTAQYIVSQILGMVRSQWSVVMFRNEPLLWLQYFCGISLGMPTIVVVRKSDSVWIPVLKDNKLVKAVFQIEDYKEPYATHVAEKIAKFVKSHPQK